MKYEAGDLVEIIMPQPPWPEEWSEIKKAALILSGHRTSVYVEDRPIRSIDTVQYSVISEGRRLSIYEEEISRQLTVGRDIIR